MKTLGDVVEEIHLGLSTVIHQNVRQIHQNTLQIHDATHTIGGSVTGIRSDTQRIITGTTQIRDEIMVRRTSPDISIN